MMNVFQAARQIDCGQLLSDMKWRGRFTSNGRGSWQCPFHDDHNPSMITYPAASSRGGYSHFYCFSCCAHGDVTDLYAQIKGLTAKKAATALCKEFGYNWDEPLPVGASPNKQTMPPDEEPQLAVILAICGKWQDYRIRWYQDQLKLVRKDLEKAHLEPWEQDMKKLWAGHFEQKIKQYSSMTEWEILHDVRNELDAIGVSPYRRCRVEGSVS